MAISGSRPICATVGGCALRAIGAPAGTISTHGTDISRHASNGPGSIGRCASARSMLPLRTSSSSGVSVTVSREATRTPG